MSDLTARLQAHFGQTYQIERELGGGGMSRVFLATEVRLGRKVVIKVLPPEMAAAVHADRFEREIQVSASLQHPHIVSLLTAGQAGDLLYYVMPYIKGETLGHRLAREGALPVSDVVRILRDVIDALAYSHAQGVVHRDIKPDNILLTGRHALVTDFGVAKAVSLSSGGGPGLTSSNVALGTPAYMAPEQAAADPHVDQRADLYAVGVVAYEMLAGRTPFEAPTPQQMLAAHVTATPVGLEQWREGLPPALTGTVMKCLVKHAADRWQTAEEVAVALEAITTTSGGTTPVGTAAHSASGARNAMRRFDPKRIATRFLAATLLVVAVAFVATRLFALPDWVWIGAGGVMLAGLPVLLYTGRVERQRVVALTMGSAAVPAPAHHEFFTWQRAKFGGYLAMGALVLVTAGFAVGRLFGIGPGATLRSSGKLGDADRLILADVSNRTGDSTLGSIITEAARVDLSQSNVVRLYGGQDLLVARQRMGMSATAPLTDSAALDLARREGAKAVIAMEVRPFGAGFVLTGAITDATTGADLVSEHEEAASTGELLAAVDRLARRLREHAGESLRSIRADAPLEQVTTPNLEALRLYTSAVRAFDLNKYDEAVPLLQRAVALDSSFAMAWRKLGVAQFNMGNSAAADSALQRAFAQRDHLTPIERYLTEAGYYQIAMHDPERGMAAYRAVLALDPTEGTAANNLGLMLNNDHRNAEAEQVVRPAAAVHDLWNLQDNLVQALGGQGKWAAGDSVIRTILARFPDRRAQAELFRAELVGESHDFRGGDSVAALIRVDSLPILYKGRLANARGAFLMALGRDHDAALQLSQAEEAAWRTGARSSALSAGMSPLLERLIIHNDTAGALRGFQQLIQRWPIESIPALDVDWITLGLFYAELGRPAEVDRMHARWTAAWTGNRPWPGMAEWWNVVMAQARRDTTAYLRALHEAAASRNCDRCSAYWLGRIYDRMGQADSAIVYWQRGEDTPINNDPSDESVFGTPVLFRLGELYEGKGDRAKAMASYEKFIDRWRDADAEHQPQVAEARKRLARLKAQTG